MGRMVIVIVQRRTCNRTANGAVNGRSSGTWRWPIQFQFQNKSIFIFPDTVQNDACHLCRHILHCWRYQKPFCSFHAEKNKEKNAEKHERNHIPVSETLPLLPPDSSSLPFLLTSPPSIHPFKSSSRFSHLSLQRSASLVALLSVFVTLSLSKLGKGAARGVR